MMTIFHDHPSFFIADPKLKRTGWVEITSWSTASDWFAFLFLWVYIIVRLIVYVCIYIYDAYSYLYIYPIHPSIYLSTYLPIFLPIYLSISLSIHPSIYLASYLSIYLSTYLLSIRPSIYLSTLQGPALSAPAQVRAATAQFLVQRVWDGAPVASIFIACHLLEPWTKRWTMDG
jgi:hypothetical protein